MARTQDTRVHTTTPSPIGELTLVGEGGALVGLYLPEHRPAPAADRLGERVDGGFEDAVTQLRGYFAGVLTRFDLLLRPVGTPLQQQVWALLTEVPYGRTTTYGELARRLGGPGLARAVGAANARNPISIVVPCHRVVGGDGRLVGYAGGLDRKRRLLDLEQQYADVLPTSRVPSTSEVLSGTPRERLPAGPVETAPAATTPGSTPGNALWSTWSGTGRTARSRRSSPSSGTATPTPSSSSKR